MIDEKENNYIEVYLKDLPSKGVFYNKDVYIKVRPFSRSEMEYMNNFDTKDNFMKQLQKLEYSLYGVKTNMDKLDFCYTDVYYLFYIMYILTYPEINIIYDNTEILYPLNPKDFLYTNQSFSKPEDLFYEKENLTFYLPSLYNMSKANENIITSAVQGAFENKDLNIAERMSLVPYLQKNKISDSALEFVNQHMMSFSNEDIEDMRTFINSKENLILGQESKIKHKNEDVNILIQLNQLI